MDGFFVFDKPAGITSHDVIGIVRKICRMKKVGHTGTLDPFATGVLPVALGEATKAIPFLDESVKEYRAVMKLGEATDTGDFTGSVVTGGEWRHLDAAAIEEVASCFTGQILQTPPMYSALKRNGVPLYRLARRGETVEREPRPVTIYSLTIDHLAFPEIGFTVRCSRGTYVRTLAADMGERLGCGAHLVKLQRTVSGPFALHDAISASALTHLAAEGGITLIPPYAALAQLRDLPLSDADAARIACGVLGGTDAEFSALLPGERIRLSCRGKLLAVAEQEGDSSSLGNKRLRLVRVFN